MEKKIIFWTICMIVLFTGVHEVALLLGAASLIATTAATAATAAAAFAVAVATVFVVAATFAATTTAAFATTTAAFAVTAAAFAVTAAAFAVAADYKIKYRWVLAAYGIEALIIFSVFSDSESAGPGALVGLAGMACLVGLWWLAKRREIKVVLEKTETA